MTREASEQEVAALRWDEIKDRLARGAAAILPIGAGAKQHGLHMPMSTDQVFAAYFSKALAKRIDALIWPTLTYGFYPAFVAYAGSVSLSGATFQATVTEIADALIGFRRQARPHSRYGPQHHRTGRGRDHCGARPLLHPPSENLRRAALRGHRSGAARAALRQPCR